MQAAIKEARYLRQIIAQAIEARPFRYFNKGSMVVVGSNYAVLERGPLRMSGFFTFLVWAFIHILFPAPTAEPPSRATPVALVVFHRSA